MFVVQWILSMWWWWVVTKFEIPQESNLYRDADGINMIFNDILIGVPKLFLKKYSNLVFLYIYYVAKKASEKR